MKKTFNLNNLKNLWFAMQLLIVSVSLPVMCAIQLSHATNDVNQKQQQEVIRNSVNQNPVTASDNNGKTVKLG